MDKEAALKRIAEIIDAIKALQNTINAKMLEIQTIADEHSLTVECDMGQGETYHGKGTLDDTWAESSDPLEAGYWSNSSTYC